MEFVLKHQANAQANIINTVSILVLMEFVLKLASIAITAKTSTGFNPCFNGICS